MNDCGLTTHTAKYMILQLTMTLTPKYKNSSGTF